MFKAIVYREHTLAVELKDNWIQPLAASILRGATTPICSGPLHVDFSDCRPAKREDFDIYRVSYHPDYMVEEE